MLPLPGRPLPHAVEDGSMQEPAGLQELPFPCCFSRDLAHVFCFAEQSPEALGEGKPVCFQAAHHGFVVPGGTLLG